MLFSLATVFKLEASLDSSDWLRLRGIAFLYHRIEDAALKPPNTVPPWGWRKTVILL